MSAKEVTTPKKHVKLSLENCKVCGITTQINARAVISNPAGKTNLGEKFPSVLQYRCGRGKGRVSLLLPKLQTETRNNSQENPTKTLEKG